jgi:hypothetical protein
MFWKILAAVMHNLKEKKLQVTLTAVMLQATGHPGGQDAGVTQVAVGSSSPLLPVVRLRIRASITIGL